MDDILLEPLKAYVEHYDKLFDENAQKYFDDLTAKSNVDVEQNRSTVKSLNKELAQIEHIEREQSKLRSLRACLIAFIVLGAIALIIGLYCVVTTDNLLWLIALFCGAASIVASAVVIAVVIKPKLRAHDEQKAKHQTAADGFRNQAWEQMAPLNEMFESSATKYLVEKTVDKIGLDDNFDMRRYDYLNGKYGLGADNGDNRSVIAVLSGEILGNPFVVERDLVEEMGTKTYTGSIVIHWTTSYTDSEGHRHTEHHSETLHASVNKPCPYYNEQTRLIYGNEAAPSLSFTHEPSHAERYSDKELSRHVGKNVKKIRKLQHKAMTDDDPSTNFTEMGNAEFDVLFGALDRNNEVEFRVLFTPLAQRNMLDIIKSDVSYGDDFYFYKRGCLNYIYSEHAKTWDLDTSYKKYQSYDIDDSFNRFLSFNKRFFKSLYFELAPLLAIPVYQQLKPVEYIYQTEYERNYTGYESECVVNDMGYRYFEHESSVTPSILKTEFLGKEGKTDRLAVTAYSYSTIERVDHVSVFGGDGRFHSVPVVWYEYIPLQQTSYVKVKQLDLSDKQFEYGFKQGELGETLSAHGNAANYFHKLLCCLVTPETANLPFDEDINKILKLIGR